MKKKFITGVLIPVLLLVFSISKKTFAQQARDASNTEQLLSYQQEISTEFLKQHLAVLSHDSLKGRETGSKELKTAARYVAKQYQELGLQPAAHGSSYFQEFTLSAIKRDSTVFELFQGDQLVDRSVEKIDTTANFIRSFGGSDTLGGEIVFAGFGLNDPSHGIRHLRGTDLQGKWVLVFQDIPHVVDGDTLIDPAINGQHRFEQIIKGKEAAGMINIPLMTEDEYQASARETARLAYAEPNRFGLPYLNDSSNGIPPGYNVIKPELAARILGIAPNLESLRQYRQSLIQEITEFSPRSTGYSLHHSPHTSFSTQQTQNVAAFFKGADSNLNEEVVVLTSHLDHVGVGAPDSTGDAIYNGADDDGSGTVAMLNVAKALARARADGYAPRRSILFLHVSAEEIGLLGSRYYSDHPLIPMDKTVANINIDMIGRIDETHKKEGVSEYAYIIGSEIISTGLDSLLQRANTRSGNIELDKNYNSLQDPNRFYRRSDHWHFGRNRVPFVFFFSGVHEDYHRPSDEIHKIRFEKMAQIIKTIYATTVVVANEEDPPAVDNEAFIEITQSNSR